MLFLTDSEQAPTAPRNLSMMGGCGLVVAALASLFQSYSKTGRSILHEWTGQTNEQVYHSRASLVLSLATLALGSLVLVGGFVAKTQSPSAEPAPSEEASNPVSSEQ